MWLSNILLALLITLSLQADGVLITTSFSNFACLKNQNKDLAIIRALQSTGTVDAAAPNNIKLSNQAGLLTDVMMVVCPGKSASGQVNQMIDYLAGKKQTAIRRLLFAIKGEDQVAGSIASSVADSIFDSVYGNIWINVEPNAALGCSWSTKTPAQNCQYIQDIITAIEQKGRSAGILSSLDSWRKILGDASACPNFAKLPLIYNNPGSAASFGDWNSLKFGGWASPNVKYYNTEAQICGSRLGLAYF